MDMDMNPAGVLGILLAFGMCVMVPLALIGGIVWVFVRRGRARHEERMAMIAQGVLPPADASAASPPPLAARAVPRSDPARGLGWAVGLVLCGVLWSVGVQHFASMLIGAGAAFLTRGIIGLRRDAAGRTDLDLPPGERP